MVVKAKQWRGKTFTQTFQAKDCVQTFDGKELSNNLVEIHSGKTSTAKILTEDLTTIIGYTGYSHHCDFCVPNIHTDIESVPEMEDYGQCKCLDKTHIKCVIISGYGEKFDSEYCAVCMVVTGEASPFPRSASEIW